LGYSSRLQTWSKIGGSLGDPTALAPSINPIPPADPNLEPGFLDPLPDASPLPNFFPNYYPGFRFEPIPVKVPYTVIPGRPNNDPGQVPGARNEVSYGTRFKPYFSPLESEAWPDPRMSRNRYRQVRTGKGIKERKLIGNFDPRSPIGRAISGITEGVDLVGCLHSALPKWARSREGGVVGRAKAIYRNIEHIDVAGAIMACAQEAAEDKFWGRVGRLEAKVNRRLGLTGGTIGRTMGNIRRAQ